MSFARIYDLADKYKVNLAGLTSWSFEFENQQRFDGFRDLATNGIDKPVLNVFRMYGLMQGNKVPVKNSHQIPLDSILKNGVHGSSADIHALACADKNTASVMGITTMQLLQMKHRRLPLPSKTFLSKRFYCSITA